MNDYKTELFASLDAYEAAFGRSYPLMQRQESMERTIQNIRRCVQQNVTIDKLEPFKKGVKY